jgi:amidohydrolase
LPGIGHGCGHNLIATSSIAAFIGLAKAKQNLGFPGRVRILGTPAEEGGGGKVKLIEAGAFKDSPSAAIMCHPTVDMYEGNYSGVAGWKLMVSYKMLVEFRGKAAHAANEPWSGVNALDAAVAAYSNISLMRQQIQLDERIHSVIEDGGKVPNVIPEYTRMNVNARSPTLERAAKLLPRVKSCFDAAAISTGCKVNYIQ